MRWNDYDHDEVPIFTEKFSFHGYDMLFADLKKTMRIFERLTFGFFHLDLFLIKRTVLENGSVVCRPSGCQDLQAFNVTLEHVDLLSRLLPVGVRSRAKANALKG